MDTRQSMIVTLGSYGWGVYAGHSTFDLDFSTPGSYGRGIYAGHSTFDLDFSTPGSYGRGVYAGHSTLEHDWTPCDDYARGMRDERRAAPVTASELRERQISAD